MMQDKDKIAEYDRIAAENSNKNWAVFSKNKLLV